MERNAYAHPIVNIGITQQLNVIPWINIVNCAIHQHPTVVMRALDYFVYPMVLVLNVRLMLHRVLHRVIVLMERIGLEVRVQRRKASINLVFGIVNVI